MADMGVPLWQRGVMSAERDSGHTLGAGEVVGESLDLARLLRERRESIVSRFVAEVKRNELSAPGAAPLLIVDHIPTFLEELAAELTHTRARHSGGAAD